MVYNVRFSIVDTVSRTDFYCFVVNYADLVKSFAEDHGQEISLDGLRSAMSGLFHYDFILFDCCLMANVEMAFELWDCADYLLFSPTEILVDGFPYEFTPKKVNYSKDGRFFMENFDEELGHADRDLAYALAHCKKANVVLVSSSGVNHRLFFREKDLRHFKQVFEAYRALGGRL